MQETKEQCGMLQCMCMCHHSSTMGLLNTTVNAIGNRSMITAGSASKPGLRLLLAPSQHAGNGCVAVSKPVGVEPCCHSWVHAGPMVLPDHASWLLLESVPAAAVQQQQQTV
jgi:hypothetical protein